MLTSALAAGATLNNAQNRKIVAGLARQIATNSIQRAQTRRRKKGKKIRFPNLLPSGSSTNAIQTTQRSAASMTVQSVIPGPLTLSDCEKCVFNIDKADKDYLGIDVTPRQTYLWPKLSEKVSTYAYYRLMGPITLTWIPSVGTGYQGSIVIGFTPDCYNDLHGYDSVAALPVTVTSPVAQSCSLVIPVNKTNQAIYRQLQLDENNASLYEVTDAMSYLGRLYWSIAGTTGSATPGYFTIEYKIQLLQAKQSTSSGALRLSVNTDVTQLRGSPHFPWTRDSTTDFNFYSTSQCYLWWRGPTATLRALTIDGAPAAPTLTYTSATETLTMDVLAAGTHTVSAGAGSGAHYAYIFRS